MPIATSIPFILLLLLSLGSQIKDPYNPGNTAEFDNENTVSRALEEWQKPENDCLDLSGIYHCPQNTKIIIHQGVSPGGHLFSIFPDQIFEDISDKNHESPKPNLMYGNFIADGKKAHPHPYFHDIQYAAQCTLNRLNIVMVSQKNFARSLQLEYRRNTIDHGLRILNNYPVQKQDFGVSEKSPLNITHCERIGDPPPFNKKSRGSSPPSPQRDFIKRNI